MNKTATRRLAVLFWLALLNCTPATRAGEPEASVDPTVEELKALSIEELLDIPLVYGASKHSQKITEAPSSISIVTADEIKKFGYRTLADVLMGVQGFYTNYDRAYGFIGVRGFNRPGDFGGRVIVLVDGHRMNDSLYDSAAIVDDFILDMDLIERVEVIRGPSFSLYGANAFFGAVNVITRKGGDMDGTEAAFRAASFDTYHGRLSFGKRFENGIEMLISGSYYDSAGPSKLFFKEFDQPENNNGIAEDRNGANAQRLFGKISFGDFKLRGGLVSRDRAIPTAPFAELGTAFNTPGTEYFDDRYFLELNFAHEFKNQWELKAKFYYDWYSFTGDYAFRNLDGSIGINRNPAVTEWFGSEVQLSKRLFDKHRLMLGIETRDTFRSEQRSFVVEPRIPIADVDISWQSYSAYFQDEYSILSNLLLNVGLRYDYYTFFGDAINPRFALIYNPLPKTTLKFLYGEAFRAPNDFERAFASLSAKPNPDLKPETIRTYELIWDQYIDQTLRFSLAGYQNEIKGLISPVQDPVDGLLFYDNLVNATTWGMDFEVEAKTDTGWKSTLSYSWQRTRDQLTGEELTNSPEHLLKLNLIAPLYKQKLFAGVQFQYSSDVRTLADNRAEDFWITNFQLYSDKLIPGFDVTAGVFNVFDQEYAYPGRVEMLQDVIQQDGRTYQFILRYRF